MPLIRMLRWLIARVLLAMAIIACMMSADLNAFDKLVYWSIALGLIEFAFWCDGYRQITTGEVR